MEVRNLIKPSGTVVQITEIHEGDVYKRLVENNYGDDKIVYGVIIDVLNNGETASLVALEFTPAAYSSDIQAVTKVFSGNNGVAVFAASVDEYKRALSEALDVQAKVVADAERETQRKRQIMLQMMAQAEKTNLSAAAVKEITA